MAFVWDFRYDDTHFCLPSVRANAIIIIKIKRRKSLSVHWALQSLCAHRGEAEWNLLPNWANRRTDDKRGGFWIHKISLGLSECRSVFAFTCHVYANAFPVTFSASQPKIIQMIFIPDSRFLPKILFLRIKIYETANRLRYKCFDADT